MDFAKKIFILVAGLIFCTSAYSRGYSGIVHISGDTFLVVHDKKHPRDKGATRVALLTVRDSKDPLEYRPLQIKLPEGELPPSDLEACCTIPGSKDEFLLAESSYYKGNFGRIFHVQLREDTVVVHSVIRPLPPLPEGQNSPDDEQIEGISCIRLPDGQTIVILGHRGHFAKPTKISWGKLDLAAQKFTKWGEVSMQMASLGYQRGCADLHLSTEKSRWLLWSVASSDNGDAGPFRSLVYQGGFFALDGGGKLEFHKEIRPLWVLDGLKVEGVTGPAAGISNSTATIVTDDENYGGVFRPLFSRKE